MDRITYSSYLLLLVKYIYFYDANVKAILFILDQAMVTVSEQFNSDQDRGKDQCMYMYSTACIM